MKAIVCRRYGPPDVLALEDVETPAPADREVLIRVHTASVNPLDRIFRGRPYIVRMLVGWTKPKDARVGHDVAGTVEAVGRNVTRFQSGDDVFGVCRGAFAEYACAGEDRLARKPANVGFHQAAAVPIAGITALQALRDKARLKAGDEVLINGAAGGVGTFAVQIARSFGARVTGVCGTSNVERVRAIGAEQVVDYSKDDFTLAANRYDVLLDCVGNRSLRACCRVLKPGGIYVLVGASTLRHSFYVFLASPFASRKVKVHMASIKKEDLAVLAEMLEAGTIVPVIDRRFPLTDVAAAMELLETKHARGKVVIAIHD